MKKQIHPAVSEFYRKLAVKGWKKRQAKLIKEGTLKVGSDDRSFESIKN